MLQFPVYSIDETAERLFQRIEVLVEVLQLVPVTPAVRQHVFHQQQLRSSLFSARIEGNLLTWDSLSQERETLPQNKNYQEIGNVVAALQLFPRWSGLFDADKLKEVHSQVLAGLDARAGKFRHEPSAIFDQYGNIVYLTPLESEMKEMLNVWLTEVDRANTLPWEEKLLQTLACHYYFEKIHPFVDGNGRTGRVVMHYQLFQMGFFKEIILPIDQYFDRYKSEYYGFLEKNTRQIQGFCQFFLEGIVWALEACLDDLKRELSGQAVITTSPRLETLFPRRQELYHLIQDHPFITLASLGRRFPTVPVRTLAYDVNQLVKAKLVIKHGTTKGVMYSVPTLAERATSLV